MYKDKCFTDWTADAMVDVTELMGAEIYLYLSMDEDTNLIARVSSRSKAKSGDTVKVDVRIREGQKTRIQAYEGVVVDRSNGGIGATFTVRKISSGVGVQRTFPVHSPIIDKITVVRHGKVRRAKLSYLKGLSAKNARIKEDRR